MRILPGVRKRLAVQIALALLPASVCASDLVIDNGSQVSAVWAINGVSGGSGQGVVLAAGNIVINGGATIDSSNISAAFARYVVYANGSAIDLGSGTQMISGNSANALTVENGGMVRGQDLDIQATDENYGQNMAQLYGINTIARSENASSQFVNLTGLSQMTLNNSSGDITGILASCTPAGNCNTSQSTNVQLENLGLNIIAQGNATGIEAAGQNIAMNQSSIVVNSGSHDANIQGLVTSGGSITAAGYTDLSVSGNGLLTAISASGPSASGLANIDLQGGAKLELIRDAGNTHGINGVLAQDGARVQLTDTWVMLDSNASVSETDRFITAQNSRDDVASTIVVDGELNIAVSEGSPLGNDLIYVGAEGNSAIDLNGSVNLGDLRTADNATAFFAQDGGKVTLNDQTVNAWGAVVADSGDIDLRTADNSYLYSTMTAMNGGTVNLALNGAGSVWDMTGNSTLTGLQLNGGTINFLNDSGSEFKTLTVNGDYHGDGGTLVMNVTLNSDNDSPGDRMVVTGDTSGSTQVEFNNIYGHGEHTDMGIELITVGGVSDGAFSLDRRVGIGLYDYALVQKGSNWYLSNSEEDVTGVIAEPETPASDVESGDDNGAGANVPEAPAEEETGNDTGSAGGGSGESGSGGAGTPEEAPAENESGNDSGNPGESGNNSDNPGESGNGSDNSGESGDGSDNPDKSGNGSGGSDDGGTQGRYDYTKVYRPESGSYIANIAAANTLFLTRLHDRQGEHEYIDPVTGERHSTTLWLRNTGSHSRFEEAGGQLISRSNSYAVQLGGDVARWSSNESDSWRFGLMAGYGHNQNKTRSELTGYTSRGQVNGYSVGLYGTWFADDAGRTGAWVDTWVQYGWFHNRVSGDEFREEKYRSRGVTASVEAGYALPVGSSERFSFWLEPRGQAVWMDVRADSLVEDQGTHVSSSGAGNVMTQLGMRAWMKGRTEKGGSDRFRPYVEANWIHNTRAFAVKMNGERNAMIGTQNLAEVRIGAEGQLNSNLALWADVGQQVGRNKYSDTRGTLGIKLQF
ncbi:autotransporter outer membrane beta-barrel domain-containing protein [Jejubacter calystegiae]|uniref:Autotransporter outer membrane beta-barrel domain-containing protein n=1 Tax=Jejubacter calystegiae TaxID=2579935 RepID=A0A4V1G7A2_9ENTR|nr:autotransporter outer membrane beta-barrel domain-containing protein [Jejubacter calystegiae]QCT18937.1 autotransporter outer membrane beta-barrel domain-containing protein [Jejubacter calystegiae]